MKRFAFLIALLAGALLAAPARAERTTLLVYMAGSDLESLGGAASADIGEMIAACPDTDDFRMALLTGGAQRWERDTIPADRTALWQVTPEGLVPLAEYERMDMGAGDTLSLFLREGMRLFPADRYMLFFWDHGGGPMGGICFDEQADMDSLGLDEIAGALEENGLADTPLALIGFDACLMGSVEVAGAVAPYAEYMVASEELIPVSGWDYSFLGALPDAADGADAGRRIVEAYMASLSDARCAGTLSCIDLGYMPGLDGALDRLFGALTDRMTPSACETVSRCRSGTKPIGTAGAGVWDLVDLGHYLARLDMTGLCSCGEALAILDRMTVANGSSDPCATGLSLYAPYENSARYTWPWASRYQASGFAEGYRRFVRAFGEWWLGGRAFTWTGPDGCSCAVSADARAPRTRVSAELSEEDAEHAVSARLLVLEELMPGEYRIIHTGPSMPVAGRRLEALYDGTGLFAVDDEERILAGPLSWRDADGGLAAGAVLERPDGTQEPVYLICRERDGAYRPETVCTYHEGPGMFFPSSLTLRKDMTLTFVSFGKTVPDTDAPYEDWPYGVSCDIQHVRLTGEGFRLRRLPYAPAGSQYAMFEIRDTQAKVHLSPMIPMDYGLSVSAGGGAQYIRGDLADVSLAGAELTGGIAGGLRLTWRIRNAAGSDLSIRFGSVSLDRKAMADLRLSLGEDLAPGAETEWTVLIPARLLQEAREVQPDDLTLALLFPGPGGEAEVRTCTFAAEIDLSAAGVSGTVPEGISAASGNAAVSAVQESVACSAGDTLTGRVRLNNDTAEPLVFTAPEVWVNGRECYGALAGGYPPYVIPAGHAAECSFTIRTRDPVTDEQVLFLRDTGEIREISWRIAPQRGDPFRLTFTLTD